jgi:pilus assembly protein CpaE
MLPVPGRLKQVKVMTMQGFEALESDVLSVALIGPDELRRKAIASALLSVKSGITQEYSSYPALGEVSQLLDASFDVYILELDSNPEVALELVEQICSRSQATVMVYSDHPNSDLLVRCMRAGAREFLNQPVSGGTISQAMDRALARRPKAAKPAKKVLGRLLVFTGAKGGAGVTTIAGNFAVALAQESEKKVVLIDLCIPLGDAAVALGIEPQFSAANAIQEYTRLDANFLNKLLTKHSSGLMVLAAPDRFTPIRASNEAIEKLLAVARTDYDYIVVDAGSSIGTTYSSLFETANTVYLVMQVSIAELRNANRLIAGLFEKTGSKLEIVLNRYNSRSMGIDEENITKALTKPASWKIPSDYIAVRQSQNTATSLALSDSPISRMIRQMARVACGKTATEEKKKFSFFGSKS